MALNLASPGIVVREVDLTVGRVDPTSNQIGAIVAPFAQGPIDVPTLITTQRQLNTVFGFPHPESSDPYLVYAAEQYLLIANELFVVRVGDEDAVSDEAANIAEVEVPSAGGQIDGLRREFHQHSKAE